MENKELLFARTLEEVRKTAKEQGNVIGEEQVREAFAALELNDEQLQMVFDYLKNHKIGIGEAVDPDAYMSGEERDYLADYLAELEALPKYSDSEKRAYTMQAMAGDEVAAQKVLEMYLPDVAELARLYAGQGVLLEDLIGVGNVALTIGTGMLGSMEEPEEVQGMLGKMIMDAMEEAIEENEAEKKQDRKVAENVNQVMEKARELSEELRRKVTAEELAEESGLSLKKIRDAQRMSGFQIEYLE